LALGFPRRGTEARDIRERLLSVLLRVTAAGGLVAVIPSAWLSIKEGLWPVLVLDCSACAFVIFLALAPRLPFLFKVGSLVSIAYALGLVLLVFTGPFGAGHLFVFAFVFLVALFGGFKAMLLANALALLTHAGFAAAVTGGLLPWTQGVGSVVVVSANFALVSLALSFAANYLITGYAAASAEDKRLKDALETMLKEIEHRVKNNLQVISSLVNIRSRAASNPAEALENIKDSLSAISVVQQLLYRKEAFYIVEIRALLASLVDRLRSLHQDIDFSFAWRGPEARMDGERAVSLGILVNEIVTNSAKHAFDPGAEGSVSVEVDFDEASREMRLRICDDGRGLGPERAGGSGLTIIAALVRQLGAEMEASEAPGLCYDIAMLVDKPELKPPPRVQAER
jgi:two-component sensor histidine kinase